MPTLPYGPLANLSGRVTLKALGRDVWIIWRHKIARICVGGAELSVLFDNGQELEIIIGDEVDEIFDAIVNEANSVVFEEYRETDDHIAKWRRLAPPEEGSNGA